MEYTTIDGTVFNDGDLVVWKPEYVNDPLESAQIFIIREVAEDGKALFSPYDVNTNEFPFGLTSMYRLDMFDKFDIE